MVSEDPYLPPGPAAHYAYRDNVVSAEQACIRAFVDGVSDETRRSLHDPQRVMPFANLEFPKGNVKAHGIKGAKAPRLQRGSPR